MCVDRLSDLTARFGNQSVDEIDLSLALLCDILRWGGPLKIAPDGGRRGIEQLLIHLFDRLRIAFRRQREQLRFNGVDVHKLISKCLADTDRLPLRRTPNLRVAALRAISLPERALAGVSGFLVAFTHGLDQRSPPRLLETSGHPK